MLCFDRRSGISTPTSSIQCALDSEYPDPRSVAPREELQFFAARTGFSLFGIFFLCIFSVFSVFFFFPNFGGEPPRRPPRRARTDRRRSTKREKKNGGEFATWGGSAPFRRKGACQGGPKKRRGTATQIENIKGPPKTNQNNRSKKMHFLSPRSKKWNAEHQGSSEPFAPERRTQSRVSCDARHVCFFCAGSTKKKGVPLSSRLSSAARVIETISAKSEGGNGSGRNKSPKPPSPEL
jgi:hypothetical protein